ncbi:MAG: chitobiase/beta-hexosaminidase C-terminal domain-containing protein [Prevotella sp.]|nr:chitobiase/beta-hexosaminidase C-terminal domain-containing protein [Prevotella sp.]
MNSKITIQKMFVSRQFPAWGLLRTLSLLCLMVVAGTVEAQTDLTGYYYFVNQADKTYYLCPAETPTQVWAEGQPYLTTHKAEENMSKFLWLVRKVGDYYYIIHEDNNGAEKYLTTNAAPVSTQAHRRRVHLQSVERLGDENEFVFAREYDATAETGPYNIYHKTLVQGIYKYLNPSGGNANNYGPEDANSHAGMIGLWNESNNAGSKWDLIPFNKCVPPVISCDEGTVSIGGVSTGSVIYFTTDGSDPDPSDDAQRYSSPFQLPPVATITTIKAVAVKDGCVNSNLITKKIAYMPEITLEGVPCTYDGEEQTPSVVSVKVGETNIPDYVVSYENNINAGNATVTITSNESSVYIVSGSKTFTIAPLTATLAWETEIPYNKTVQKPTATVANLITGDECEVTVSVAEGDGINCGQYTATATALSNTNYQLPTETTTIFSITKIPLSITAETKTKVYGDDDPVFTYSEVSGLLEGDEVSGALSRADVDNQNVGEYAITEGTLTAGSNYVITLNDAKLTITPAPLTVTANDVEKNYGEDDPELTYHVGDGELKYEDTIGDALTGALSRENGEDSKAYVISQGDLAATANYSIASFAGATFTIHGTAITPTVTLADWTYGSPKNPSVSGNTGKGKVTYTYKKQSEGDDKYTSTKPTNVGTYTVKAEIAAIGAYEAGVATTNFSITKASIIIKAVAKEKDYLDVDPELTFDVEGLKNSDAKDNVVTCELQREEGENAGTYSITKISHQVKSSNYVLGSFVAGTLTINKKNLGNGETTAAGITINARKDGESWIVSLYNGERAFAESDYTYVVSEAGDGENIVTVTARGDNCTGSAKASYSSNISFYPLDDTATSEKVAAYISTEQDQVTAAVGVRPYIISRVNPSVGTVSLYPLSYIPKDTPVLLLAEHDATGLTVYPKTEDIKNISGNVLENNKLMYVPDGEAGVEVEATETYVYYRGEFVLTLKGTITPHHFYIYNPNYVGSDSQEDPGNPASSRSLRLIKETATDMVKLIKDQPSVHESDEWYTIDGLRFSGKPTKKGLYIRNNQKVLVR